MKLSKNWFVEGLLDSEYQQYRLLAYLKHVSNQFDQALLYPELSEVLQHYNWLKEISHSLQKLENEFPRKLIGLDWKHKKLKFEKYLKAKAIREIEDILIYSLPKINTQCEAGRELYSFIKTKLKIEPVGIEPLYKQEGYLLVASGNRKSLHAYNYKVSSFTTESEKLHLSTTFVGTYQWTISNSVSAIKQQIARTHPKLPNPATYYIASELNFPVMRSLLPVAKREFVEKILV